MPKNRLIKKVMQAAGISEVYAEPVVALQPEYDEEEMPPYNDSVHLQQMWQQVSQMYSGTSVNPAPTPDNGWDL
jgi:hypothetical protein